MLSIRQELPALDELVWPKQSFSGQCHRYSFLYSTILFSFSYLRYVFVTYSLYIRSIDRIANTIKNFWVRLLLQSITMKGLINYY